MANRNPIARRLHCAQQAPESVGEGGAVERIDDACVLAAAGRLAVRELARWVRGSGVSEVEFRLLWALGRAEAAARSAGASRLNGKCAVGVTGDAIGAAASGDVAVDQTALARGLAVSAAQVSGAVERLEARGWIARETDGDDRRRRLWRIADGGAAIVQQVVAAVDAMRGQGPEAVAA